MADLPAGSGMGRGGLDRYLGPQAKDSSNLPPSVNAPDDSAERQRTLDCAGTDANEAVCEIANAEEEEREQGSNAT